MTINYREIYKLHSLVLNKTDIASTMFAQQGVSNARKSKSLRTPVAASGRHFRQGTGKSLFPIASVRTVFKMPDYAHMHREMHRHGVTLPLLWLEYCDQCKAEGAVP